MNLKKLYFVFFLLVAISIKIISQPIKQKDIKISIKEVVLSDTALINAIDSFIKIKSEKDSIFNKLGYILLIFHQQSYQDRQTLYSCFFNECYDSYDYVKGTKGFPLFYTYIGNRIVIIKYSVISSSLNYSVAKKSIIAFKKRIDPFLPKKEKRLFKEENGSVKKITAFRESIIVIHGGKTFYRLVDGSIIIEDNKY
jgi:hypothetical protein